LLKFFTWFLLSDNIQGINIWNKYKEYFIQNLESENDALIYVNDILNKENMSNKDFGLPNPNYDYVNNYIDQSEIDFYKKEFNDRYEKLNCEQLSLFNHIISGKQKLYFIDGPGGSGKTFLYKTLIYYFLSNKKKILSMAWTVIASILLPKGMTSHKTFKLPLDLTYVENVFFKSGKDKIKLREADIIIWDEKRL